MESVSRFECRLDPRTGEVIPWALDEESLEVMQDVESLLQYVEDVAPPLPPPSLEGDSVEDEGTPAETRYMQCSRDRLKSGFHQKMHDMITLWFVKEATCTTLQDCAEDTDFMIQIAPFQSRLKAPFDGIQHATVQSFRKQFNKCFPREEFPVGRYYFICLQLCHMFTLYFNS